ncbi:hypothetical protein [Pseudomonas sp. MUP55]|uniref:hypothetical protein n=1 Tax=Pseudomonas sp. MUP55 TaxID=3087234 RepID=UPI002A59F29D|nr:MULTISPECIES: hypothetical protein [unclassified Pseudomonas]WPN92818.1 hypothetical protein SC319_00100 [Pseudomonas sp. MUP56]WPN98344.1 hypothetical protein SC318_00100 [Pseudomonas sp. MUP55]
MFAHLQALPGSLLILLGSILGLHRVFVLVEETFSEASRAKMGNRLLTGDFRKGTRKVLELYLSLNNTLFGKKIFSLRSFVVSVSLTSIWGVCFTLNYAYTFPAFKNALFMMTDTSNLRDLAIIAFFVVLIVDYLSISMTRKIYRTTVAKGKRSFFAALIFDLIGSITLYYIGISLFRLIISSDFLLSPFDSVKIWSNPTQISMGMKVVRDFDFSAGHQTSANTFQFDQPLETVVTYMFPEGVFFISSLMTSIWLWAYLLAYAAAWLMVRVNKIKRTVLPHLNIDKKPLTALTGIATAILMLGIIGSALLKL